MKVLNLKELAEIFEMEAEKKYAVAVIDNASPSQPRLGRNFVWICKIDPIPTGRKELEELFSRYGIKVEKDQSIAVFHHHDFREPYLQFKENVECYEFSHTDDSIAYRAFCHADANLLSHILSGTFRKYDKIRLVKAELSENEIGELQKYWIFKEIKKSEGVGEEESILYSIALELAGGKIVPDPKRYKPEVHNELIKTGIPTDQYAIPAMFKEVEIQTGIKKLDEEVAKRMIEKKTDFQKEIERLEKDRITERLWIVS